MHVVLTNPPAAGAPWSPCDLSFEVRDGESLVVRLTGEEVMDDADALGLWDGPGREIPDLLRALERQYRAEPPAGPQAQRLERLIALTALLVRAVRPLTTAEIGDGLKSHYGEEGTHKRTLQRDLELLDQAGLGLEREGAQGSRYGVRFSIAPQRFALALTLTTAQREVLDFLWTQPQADPRGSLARALRTAMLKLAGGGRVGALEGFARDLPRRPAPHPRAREESDALALWLRAWLERRVLGFGYGDPPTPRRVQALGFFPYDGFYYGVGREGPGGPTKTFKLVRLRSPVELLEQEGGAGEVFDMHAYLARPPWGFGPRADTDAVLELDDQERARLERSVRPADLVALGGGRHRLRVRGADGDALFAWFTQREGRVRLLEPEALRQAWRGRLAELLRAYEDGRSPWTCEAQR